MKESKFLKNIIEKNQTEKKTVQSILNKIKLRKSNLKKMKP